MVIIHRAGRKRASDGWVWLWHGNRVRLGHGQGLGMDELRGVIFELFHDL